MLCCNFYVCDCFGCVGLEYYELYCDVVVDCCYCGVGVEEFVVVECCWLWVGLVYCVENVVDVV